MVSNICLGQRHVVHHAVLHGLLCAHGLVRRASRQDELAVRDRVPFHPSPVDASHISHACRQGDEHVHDMALAQTYVRHHLDIFLTHGEQYMVTRMYTSLAGIVEGWTKNLATGVPLAFPPIPLVRWLAAHLMWLPALLWIVPALAWGLFGLGW